MDVHSLYATDEAKENERVGREDHIESLNILTVFARGEGCVIARDSWL
jgi:hypothetical protein